MIHIVQYYINLVSVIKDRNGMELTEAEEVARIHRRYTEELTKKIFMTQIITMV